jgi:hypothetical protein
MAQGKSTAIHKPLGVRALACGGPTLVATAPSQPKLAPPAQLGLLKKANLWPLTQRRPPRPFPRLGRQSPGSIAVDDFGRAVSRILSAPKPLGGENHLSQQPVPGTRSALRNLERAAPRSPIWPCTRWGFPCLRACAWSGGLLPHLFTLTPASSPKPGRFDFLWHCPSGRLAASPPACIPP